MFDTKTLKVIKSIDVMGNPDGILQDAFNQRIYILSHAAPHVTVIDAKSGDVLGTIDLGGAPEQAASDGKGHIYIDVSDKANVAVVDAKTMTVTAHYDLGDKGNGLAGLAMDIKNDILFVAARNSGMPPAQPAMPTMVILSAKDGKILKTLPLAGASDGAAFNPATKEAFSTHGNGTLTVVKETSPTTFEVEQNLDTMAGAKTLTLDTKTNHILTMAAEYAPVPDAPAATPGGAQPRREVADAGEARCCPIRSRSWSSESNLVDRRRFMKSSTALGLAMAPAAPSLSRRPRKASGPAARAWSYRSPCSSRPADSRSAALTAPGEISTSNIRTSPPTNGTSMASRKASRACSTCTIAAR